MEWVKEQIRKAMSKIRFTECNKVLALGEVPKEQWHLFNVETKPSMDYKELQFDLVINFGTYEKYKSLYTPDFTRTLEICIAPISEKLIDPNTGLLTKTMKVSIPRNQQ